MCGYLGKASRNASSQISDSAIALSRYWKRCFQLSPEWSAGDFLGIGNWKDLPIAPYPLNATLSFPIWRVVVPPQTEVQRFPHQFVRTNLPALFLPSQTDLFDFKIA